MLPSLNAWTALHAVSFEHCALQSTSPKPNYHNPNLETLGVPCWFPGTPLKAFLFQKGEFSWARRPSELFFFFSVSMVILLTGLIIWIIITAKFKARLLQPHL